MDVETRAERPDTAVARQLIEELDSILTPAYPPESRHGYSVDRLVGEDVSFFVVYVDGAPPAGCGGIQLLEGYAELKRVYRENPLSVFMERRVPPVGS